jgi:hypothetical protein
VLRIAKSTRLGELHGHLLLLLKGRLHLPWLLLPLFLVVPSSTSISPFVASTSSDIYYSIYRTELHSKMALPGDLLRRHPRGQKRNPKRGGTFFYTGLAGRMAWWMPWNMPELLEKVLHPTKAFSTTHQLVLTETWTPLER